VIRRAVIGKQRYQPGNSSIEVFTEGGTAYKPIEIDDETLNGARHCFSVPGGGRVKKDLNLSKEEIKP
jgi:hypothetical protein